MRKVSELYKVIQLATPILSTSTRTGVGQLFTPNELDDAMAIVNLGAVAGTPDSLTAVVTIEQSATLNGTYTVTDTFPTATAGAQVGSRGFKLDTAKPYVRAVVTLAFVGGTTPSIANSVSILVKSSVNSSSIASTLA